MNKNRIIGSYMLQLVDTPPNTFAYKLIIWNMEMTGMLYLLRRMLNTLSSSLSAMKQLTTTMKKFA